MPNYVVLGPGETYLWRLQLSVAYGSNGPYYKAKEAKCVPATDTPINHDVIKSYWGAVYGDAGVGRGSSRTSEDRRIEIVEGQRELRIPAIQFDKFRQGNFVAPCGVQVGESSIYRITLGTAGLPLNFVFRGCTDSYVELEISRNLPLVEEVIESTRCLSDADELPFPLATPFTILQRQKYLAQQDTQGVYLKYVFFVDTTEEADLLNCADESGFSPAAERPWNPSDCDSGGVPSDDFDDDDGIGGGN